MKFRNAIKKIAALGVGATMLGTTMMGALAADLSNYPNMFMQDHKFNAVLVVGSNAAPIDIVGAIDMAYSLQAAATETTDVSVSGASTVTASSGVEVAASGNHLNLGEAMSAVQASFNNKDLPVLLADGTVTNDDTNTDYDYTQKLSIPSNTVTFSQNDDVDAKDPKLYIDQHSQAYNLTVHFKKAINFADLNNNEPIVIMGKTFTADASMSAAGDDLVLYASQKTNTIKNGETQTITLNNGKQVEIQCESGNTRDSSATLYINNKLQVVNQGDTVNVEGTTIYFSRVSVADVPVGTVLLEYSVGSDKLTIPNGDEYSNVQINGEDLTGYYAKFGSDLTDVTNIYFKFDPNDLDSDADHYLANGENQVDPLFGTFKEDFAGVTPALKSSDRTMVSLDRSGDRYKLTFTNKDADKYSFDLYDSDNGNALSYAKGVVMSVAKDTDIAKSSIFILNDGDITKVFKLYNVDSSNGAIIQDLTDNSKTDGYVVGDTLFGNYKFDAINDSANTIQLSGATLNTITTQYDGVITINPTNISFAEDSNDFEQSADATKAETILLTVATDADHDIKLVGPSADTNLLVADDSNGDWEYGLTTLGTYYVLEKNDKGKSFDLYYPEEEAQYHVFFTPVDATISTTAGGQTVKTTKINKINVGAAKLGNEITDLTAQNLIVVGGPCVNSVASKLMGSPAKCSDGFEPGKAIIKLFNNGDKVAMLVAGYSGDDTRRATTVLAKYDQYASQLTGTEVSVGGTSLSDITISPVVQQ